MMPVYYWRDCFGQPGIEFKPVSVPTERSPEPIEKAIRDGARAVLGCNGHTGSTLTKKGADKEGVRVRGQGVRGSGEERIDVPR